jgi:hypothetical protein
VDLFHIRQKRKAAPESGGPVESAGYRPLGSALERPFAPRRPARKRASVASPQARRRIRSALLTPQAPAGFDPCPAGSDPPTP